MCEIASALDIKTVCSQSIIRPFYNAETIVSVYNFIMWMFCLHYVTQTVQRYL